MCQDCYGGSYADDDLGYDDQDDDWGGDGYEGYPADDDWDGDRDGLDDYDEMSGWPEYPDPWDYRPSLRERIGWRIRDWRRGRVQQYSDEPPF